MKPLFVLCIAFIVSLIINNFFSSHVNVKLSGKIALAAMLVFTSLGHFIFTKGMILMLPNFIPYKAEIIYATGLVEILAAVGIFIPFTRSVTGVLLIVFFVLILPSNIYASIRHLNYETANFDGNGVAYLWFRIPFQLLLIAWTYFFVLK